MRSVIRVRILACVAAVALLAAPVVTPRLGAQASAVARAEAITG